MKVRTRPTAPVSLPPAETRPLISFPVALAIYFGLALLYFLPAFLPDRHIFGTDYLASGYSSHEFISRQFAAGELPKWIPYVYGGLPLFANPGSTYYPFRFLADLIFPVSKIWPTLFVIHFTIAGAGMYLLARELRIRPWVAFVAGLAFQFTGLMMSWVLAGHEGRIIVATLTPLLFFFLHRGIRTGRTAPFAGAAATIGFSLLTFQIQSSYYLLVGAGLWSAFAIFNLGVYRDARRLVSVLLLGLGAVACGFVLAAVNFLPFLDYVDASPRGGPGRGYEYSISYSMPLEEVTAIAIPEQAGYLQTYGGTNPMKLHVEYVGAVVLMLVALGFSLSRRNRYWWFFVGLGLFALTISLGGNTPLYRLYYELLPGTKKFRAPAISFFLVSFALVTMAAIALEALAARLAERGSGRRLASGGSSKPADRSVWILGGMVALAFLGGIVASGAGTVAYRFAFFASITAVLLWAWIRGSLGVRTVAVLLSAVTVTDLWIVDRKFFDTVPPPEEMFAQDDVVAFLRAQPGVDRVWVFPFPPRAVYRRQHANYLMLFGIDQAGGEHGNQLQRWNEYVGAGEETYVDWHNFLRHPAFMDAANIRYIIAGAPVEAIRLPEAHRGSAVVYENPQALPRAYLVPRVVTTDRPDGALALMQAATFDPRHVAIVNSAAPFELPSAPLTGSAEVVRYAPDRVGIRTRASRAALLVLADNFYEGWVARVDGKEVPILRTNHTLRGVVVPAGDHLVEFTYEPRDLFTGFAISLAGAAIFSAYALFLLVQHFRTSRRGPAAA